ncbi:MAG TPA: WecB/TagA/CpsF family glycosyltransferase, partial [Thermoanaerobacterales bacterium]|nr:WecB/TagA/CpsF family glycosyltransferase [Thermoanaerobacterales bacterium]
LMNMILKESPGKKYRIYLLGSKPGIAKLASAKIKEKYPGIKIEGYHHGYFSIDDEEKIIKDINYKKPDFLFVGLGAPRQEKWIFENLEHLDVKVCMGIGGSIDIFAGKVKRAPLIFQKLGLEWFYRLIKEPRRIGRMLALPHFVLKVLFLRDKQISS